MINDDMELVREYAATHSEPAFEALVARNAGLVHSAALRQVGDAQLAEEITQTVFTILARKAGSLNPKTILPGWLYRTTRYVSAAGLKIKRRRERREQEAHVQAMIEETPADPAWEQLAPMLDEAMAQLRDQDRDAIVLRYFQNKSLRDVGVVLGVDEYAAQKRVVRALEKLRAIFFKRGAISTTVVIAGLISANSVHAVPAALVKSATAIAVAQSATASSSTLTLIKGALKIMAWTKMKVAVVVGVSVLFAAGTTTVTIQKIEERRNEVWQLGEASYQTMQKLPPQTVILPTKVAKRTKRSGNSGMSWDGDGRVIAINKPVFEIVAKAYLPYAVGNLRNRVVLNTPLPSAKYDFLSNLPHGAQKALQTEVKRKFGVTGTFKGIETNVWLLKVKYPNSRGLKLSVDDSGSTNERNDGLSVTGGTMENLAVNLENGRFGIFVVNETGLTNHFDYELNWASSSVDDLNRALVGQLGLELVPTNMVVKMLVVDKAL